MRTILLSQLAATLCMTGLIWFVQLVHYPLFAFVGQTGSAVYEAEHARRTTWVVAPLMCIELATAFLFLLPRLRPAPVSAAAAWSGLALVGAIWLSTALVQVPLHTRLGAGFHLPTIEQLVATNWIRTIAWTARSALMLVWVGRLLR